MITSDPKVVRLVPKAVYSQYGAVMRQVRKNDEDALALVFPCIHEYGILTCSEARPHAHLVVECREGIGIVRPPIFSAPFLKFVLTHLECTQKMISPALHQLLLASERHKVDSLRQRLQPEERKISDDRDRAEEALRFGIHCF